MTDELFSRLSLQLRRHGENQALLFTGSGFSLGAINVAGRDMLTGQGLIEYLKRRTGEDVDDLGLLSRVFVDKFGEIELFQILTTEFRTKQVGAHHREILSFPWKAVYTTNYDDVAEKAASESGVASRTYSQHQHPNVIEPSSLPLIHLNGYINEVTFKDFQTKIKLTNVSYLSDDISKSPWGEKFRSDILTAPCMVFVGYSMFDLDIARIIYQFPDMKGRIYFVTGPSPSRALRIKLEDFGKILDVDGAAFGKFLRGVKLEGIEKKALYFTNIDRFQRPSALAPRPTDAQVRDLLVLGDLDRTILASELARGASNYALPRDCVSKACEIILGGDKSNIVLSSNTGNGKSICSTMIGHKLVLMGAEVFRIESNTKKVHEELAQIRGIEGKKVFIIEDIFAHLDTVRAIQSFNFPSYAVIACARSTTYDLRRAEVSKLFGDDFFDFDLDQLSGFERSSLISFFNTYGYWRDLHRETDSKKNTFVVDECSGELRAVLLHFLDTQPIRQKILQIFRKSESLSDDESRVRRLLIVAQMIVLAGQPPRFEVMSNILEFDAFKAASQAPGEYREFLRVREDYLSLRSPILSDYIVKNILDSDFLIDTMIDVVTRLDVLSSSESSYDELMKTFVRYSFLERYLPPNQKRDFLIKFYENVKALNKFRQEPLFWLQYAIARLSLREFHEAKLLFDAAYSFAKARGYTENRHINNQYARYLLESRMYSDDYGDFSDAFKQAHKILWGQMVSEPLGYSPYRVAQRYLEFVKIRKDQLSQGDKIFVVRACVDILKKIASAPARLKEYPNVQQCEKYLKQVSTLLGSEVLP